MVFEDIPNSRISPRFLTAFLLKFHIFEIWKFLNMPINVDKSGQGLNIISWRIQARKILIIENRTYVDRTSDQRALFGGWNVDLSILAARLQLEVPDLRSNKSCVFWKKNYSFFFEILSNRDLELHFLFRQKSRAFRHLTIFFLRR